MNCAEGRSRGLEALLLLCELPGLVEANVGSCALKGERFCTEKELEFEEADSLDPEDEGRGGGRELMVSNGGRRYYGKYKGMSLGFDKRLFLRTSSMCFYRELPSKQHPKPSSTERRDYMRRDGAGNKSLLCIVLSENSTSTCLKDRV